MTGQKDMTAVAPGRCDVKVWSGACEHGTYTNMSEKYLCDACGKISRLDHEVSHDGFIHLKGDEAVLC